MDATMRMPLHTADCLTNIVDDTDFMLQRLDQCFERMAQHCAKGNNQSLVDLYGIALNHVACGAVAKLGPAACRNILAMQVAMLDKLVS
jgi:hypothetical protein